MLTPQPSQQIFLAVDPVDMRGGFDKLAGLVLQARLDLYAGHLFVFVSKRRTHLKVLTWDGTGVVVLYKRLAKNRFVLPDVASENGTATLAPAALAVLLEGLQVRGVRRSQSVVREQAGIDTAEAS